MNDQFLELIDKIIENLIDENSNLNSALLKTQVLADYLQNNELRIWVGKELNGYSRNDLLPNYRIIDANVRASIIEQHLIYKKKITNTILPIEKLTKDERPYVKWGLRMSISQLEANVATKGSNIKYDLPSSAITELNTLVIGEIYHAYVESPMNVLYGVLTSIKSILIDTLLKIKKKLGDENLPIMAKKKKVDQIIKTNLQVGKVENLSIQGDGGIQNITSGNKNKINSSMGDINFTQEKKNELKELLSKLKNDLKGLSLEEEQVEDVEMEIIKTTKELRKEDASILLVNQSLKTMYDVLSGVVGNLYTEPIQNWINFFGN